jgi:hypothetical protein
MKRHNITRTFWSWYPVRIVANADSSSKKECLLKYVMIRTQQGQGNILNLCERRSSSSWDLEGAKEIYYWLLGRVKKTREVKDRTNIGQVLVFPGRSLVVMGSSANIA